MNTIANWHLFDGGGSQTTLNDGNAFRSWLHDLKPGQRTWYTLDDNGMFTFRKADQEFRDANEGMFKGAKMLTQNTLQNVLQAIDNAYSSGMGSMQVSSDGLSARFGQISSGAQGGTAVNMPNGSIWYMYGANPDGTWGEDTGAWDTIANGKGLDLLLDQISNPLGYYTEEEMAKNREQTANALRSWKLIDSMGKRLRDEKKRDIRDLDGNFVGENYAIMQGVGAPDKNGNPTIQLYLVSYKPGVNNDKSAISVRPIGTTGRLDDVMDKRDPTLSSSVRWVDGQLDHRLYEEGEEDPETGGEDWMLPTFGSGKPNFGIYPTNMSSSFSYGPAAANWLYWPKGSKWVLNDGYTGKQNKFGDFTSFFDSNGREVPQYRAMRKVKIYPDENDPEFEWFGKYNPLARGGQMKTRVPKYLRDEYGRKLVRVPGWGDDDTDVYF